MSNAPFDATAYWSQHEFKKFVVSLHTRRGLEIYYVRARTHEGALYTARRESTLGRHARGSARLATPTDLGCVPANEVRA